VREANVDIASLRAWIGSKETAEDLLTPVLADRFCKTLDLPGSTPRAGEPAPRLIHFCLCQPAAPTSSLGSDGHIARGQFLPPVPLPRRMWAAGDLRFFGDLIVGQTIRRQSRVTDVAYKAGRSGPLCFVTVDHRIEADDVLRIEDRQTIVYRDDQPQGSRATAVASPPEGIIHESVEAPSALLFRYSALTFNSHRIHYDRPYAMDEEGYPGLVVQGPLQATWLFHFAAKTAGGEPPERFSFRGASPIFDFDELRLVAGVQADKRREFWTARADGQVAMQAEAFWS